MTPAPDAELSRRIVGTWWIADEHSVPSETTYASDGTFVFRTLPPKRTVAGGSWRIENGVLLIEVQQSNNPEQIPVGFSTGDRIVGMRADEHVLLTSQGKRLLRIRKP